MNERERVAAKVALAEASARAFAPVGAETTPRPHITVLEWWTSWPRKGSKPVDYAPAKAINPDLARPRGGPLMDDDE